MNIVIDDDLADKITVQTLLESLEINREQSAELMAKDVLENYEAIDLADQLKAIKALEYVLSLYMTASEYEARVGKKLP